jgi:hypothetical protein
MPKSAQEKFNEFLDECRETSDAVREFVDMSYDNHKSYGHAAGALTTIVQDLIAELPRAKRAAMRDRLYGMAQKQKNELLLKSIKESA